MWSILLPALCVTVVAANPGTCRSCLVVGDAQDCLKNETIQTCATDAGSLGTTHCYSGAGRILNQESQLVQGFARGCINCTSKEAACEKIKTFVKQQVGFDLQDCAIECCTSSNCNNATINPPRKGPVHCRGCYADNWDECDKKGFLETCGPTATHCFSAADTYNTASHSGLHGVVRGCMDKSCTNKQTACNTLKSFLKSTRQHDVTKCEIDCCTGENCNANTRPSLPNKSPVNCRGCYADSLDDCDKKGFPVTCGLTATHCFTANGTYNTASQTGLHGVFRGCMDDSCTNKQTACNTLKSFLKRTRQYDLTKCEIDCCTGDNCNDNTRTNKSNHSNVSGVTAIVILVLGLLSIF